GHASHTKNLQVNNAARNNGVILICFPPHCSHHLQPLDVAFMNPLSLHYDEEARKWLRTNPGKVVTLFEISRLFGQAFLSSANIRITIHGFEKTGDPDSSVAWPAKRKRQQRKSDVIKKQTVAGEAHIDHKSLHKPARVTGLDYRMPKIIPRKIYRYAKDVPDMSLIKSGSNICKDPITATTTAAHNINNYHLEHVSDDSHFDDDNNRNNSYLDTDQYSISSDENNDYFNLNSELQTSNQSFYNEAVQRTDHDFTTKRPDHHSGTSILELIPNLDMIKDIPLDYMHLICLGVMRKLLNL
ncbi:hypothetical protein ILUMI_08245, partial [Ignelater luminosus]